MYRSQSSFDRRFSLTFCNDKPILDRIKLGMTPSKGTRNVGARMRARLFAWPTKKREAGVADAKEQAFDRAAIALIRQLLPLLNGQTAQVITTVLVSITATVASMSQDPERFCTTIARDAIALVRDTKVPIGKLNGYDPCYTAE
jgi:hypothetical protein